MSSRNFWRSFQTSKSNRLRATPRPNIGARVISDISQMALEEHWIRGVLIIIYNIKKDSRQYIYKSW